MYTAEAIKDRFGAKRSDIVQRMQIVEKRLKLNKDSLAAKPNAENAAAVQAEIGRLAEKLVQLRVNVRDCDDKIAKADVVAARRNLPHDFKSRVSKGRVLRPNAVESGEEFGKV
ncbi:MAG: hypothetical protein ACRD1X_14575 [Vicinamibacteria bacterium]